MDREGIAWAAGFFDGEGCFSYIQRSRFVIASVAQVDRETLDRFHEVVRVGSVKGPYPPREGTYNKSPQFRFQAYGENAVVIAETLWPFLGGAKRNKGASVLLRYRRFRHSTWEQPEATEMPTQRENLAWAAGFIDADGAFARGKVANYRCVAITQTERDPLDRFQDIVGLGRVLGPYKQGTDDCYRRKPVYFYQASTFEETQAIAAMLWFKLGTAKKEQAIAVLDGYAFCKRGHRKGRSRGCPTCLSEYWRIRRERGDFIREPAGIYNAPPWRRRGFDSIGA